MPLPQPSGAFEWVQEPWGRALRCTAISTRHLFSTSDLDLRKADGQPAAAWHQLASTLGVAAPHVLCPKQVHGDAVTFVREVPPDTKEVCAGAADIIMTATPAIAVAVQAADCVPLLFQDRRTGAVAAAHAGWRGTAAGVARKTVRAMGERFGTRAGDLVVAIGPSIGPCCYRVGEELLAAFGAEGRRWFCRLSHELMLNLWSANRDQLAEAGVNGEHIHVAELCTAMHPDLFPSFRRDGDGTGRIAAAIRSAPGRTP